MIDHPPIFPRPEDDRSSTSKIAVNGKCVLFVIHPLGTREKCGQHRVITGGTVTSGEKTTLSLSVSDGC